MNTALRCIGGVAAWLALAPAAHAALPGANGMIAFDCGGICTVNPDGSGLHKVGAGTKPAWSPDGNRIVFERVTEASDPFSDLYAMDADGSNVTQLTATSGPDFTPAFSADGSRVVYGTTDTPGVYISLFSVRADGSDRKPITPPNSDDSVPSWSGDNRLAFQRGTYICGSSIVTSAPDGSGEQTVAPGGTPDWAPNGQRIVYSGCGEIWSMRDDGSDARALVTDPVGFLAWPVYSPDGTRIAYGWSDVVEGRFELWTAAADGSGAKKLPLPIDGGMDPDWQPCVAGVTRTCVSVTPPPATGGGGPTGGGTTGGGTTTGPQGGGPVPSAPPRPAARRLRVIGAKGHRLRVRVEVLRPGARLTATLRRAGRKTRLARVRRRLKVGSRVFSVPLARALRRGAKLSLDVRVAAPGARAYRVTRRVTVRRR
jgi:WD40-like Beta Propeller Repeat